MSSFIFTVPLDNLSPIITTKLGIGTSNFYLKNNKYYNLIIINNCYILNTDYSDEYKEYLPFLTTLNVKMYLLYPLKVLGGKTKVSVLVSTNVYYVF